MKAYTKPEEVLEILATETRNKYHAIIKGDKGHPYIYSLDDPDLDKEWNGRELIRLAVAGDISIIDVEDGE